MPKKAAGLSGGCAEHVGEDISPSGAQWRVMVEGKTSSPGVAHAADLPPAAVQTVLTSCLFCGGLGEEQQKTQHLWKPPAAITGEGETVYKLAAGLSSQCPILQRKKKKRSVTAVLSARCLLDLEDQRGS